MKTLAGVDRKQPQSAYAGLQKLLQQEWAFVQRVIPGIGDNFGPVEEALQGTFLPSLSQSLGEGAPGRGVTRLPAKQAGLSLTELTKTAPENWMESCVITGYLVTAPGARRSSRRRTNWLASKRDGRRCGSGASCWRKRPWQIPYRDPLSKAHVDCDGQFRRGHG